MDLRDPRYNLRQVCLNWLLLEQHLTDREQYCPDCIRKHAMLAEAYANEAFQLDARREYTALCEDVRQANGRIQNGIREGLVDTAGIVRQARKALQPLVF